MKQKNKTVKVLHVLNIDNPIDRGLISNAMKCHRNKMSWWQLALILLMVLCMTIGTQISGIGVMLIIPLFFAIYFIASQMFFKKKREWLYRYHLRSVKSNLRKMGFDWNVDVDSLVSEMNPIWRYLDSK